MGEIVNLRRARKAAARAGAQARAAENRARHGRSLAAKDADRAEAARIARTLDGACLKQATPDAGRPDNDEPA